MVETVKVLYIVYNIRPAPIAYYPCIHQVLRMMERGSDSINNLLSYVIFNIMPTLADIGIAVAYFTAAFGVYYGMIV